MANTKAAASLGSSAPTGKQSFLPPKCPFPAVPLSYDDYGSMVSKGILDPRYGQSHHRRTSSENFLIEEQPPWLDDLLNEPETPVKRAAHRRSSSDSFAYLSGANISSSITNLALEESKQGSATAFSSWGLNEFDNLRDINHASYYVESNSFGRPQHRGWESTTNMGSISLGKDKTVHKGVSNVPKEHNVVSSDASEKKEQQESAQDPKCSSEKKEASLSKQSEVDPRTTKQQFARRARVRKLQYIAELERNVQALEAEGLEISAELEFLDRQNLMLNLENKALRQQLDSLSQEQLIKCLQQEMLEREIARLRTVYQQQQQLQQQPAPLHGRSRSRDLDSQFANLSLKHKDTNTGPDPVTGPLRI